MIEDNRIYYMAYEDFDYESHYPIGFFEDLKTLKKAIIKEYNIEGYKKNLNLSYTHVSVYKFKMNEIFEFCSSNKIDFWWKEE